MALRLTGRLARRRGPVGDRCPIGRNLQIVGSRSAFLLLREALYGTTRFDDMVRLTGFTEAVAAKRLKELVGHDLLPALFALAQWGRTHSPRKGGAPTLLHDGCEAEVRVVMQCAAGHLVV